MKKLKCIRCQKRKCIDNNFLCEQCFKEWKVIRDKAQKLKKEIYEMFEISVKDFSEVFLEWLKKYWDENLD